MPFKDQQMPHFSTCILKWFKINNYYQQIQRMSKEMLAIDKDLPERTICNFIFKILPLYIQDRLGSTYPRMVTSLGHKVQKLETGYKCLIFQGLQKRLRKDKGYSRTVAREEVKQGVSNLAIQEEENPCFFQDERKHPSNGSMSTIATCKQDENNSSTCTEDSATGLDTSMSTITLSDGAGSDSV